MTPVIQMITQFYLPPNMSHTIYLQVGYLVLLPSRRLSLPFGWYLLCIPTEGWPGWVDLHGWLYRYKFPARSGSLAKYISEAGYSNAVFCNSCSCLYPIRDSFLKYRQLSIFQRFNSGSWLNGVFMSMTVVYRISVNHMLMTDLTDSAYLMPVKD